MLKVKAAQSYLTLCDPMDYTRQSLARILEWVDFTIFRGYSQPRDGNQVSPIAGRFFISCATREAQRYYRPNGEVERSLTLDIISFLLSHQVFLSPSSLPVSSQIHENMPPERLTEKSQQLISAH